MLNALPGACAQGLIWGLMAIGVYITYQDTGRGRPDRRRHDVYRRRGLRHDDAQWLQHMRFRFCARSSRVCWPDLSRAYSIRSWEYPAILAGILTQLALYSINLRILGTRQPGRSACASTTCCISLLYIPRAIWISADVRRALLIVHDCTGSSARSWVPRCVQPAATSTWRARRASTPTLIRCWA